ncbi:MAG: hypothetical protein CVT74_15195 [Alphaproteobacteria bacterium HGW-Alphaproteobacteria-13]|jgi:cysteine sulfinate desulfinase/cysteine desulfurase-like protein|nr:MAG: hypothetical protein CVT74_15195 [Alphaproteobacteria bacterium HGW-Alphaproteobacteria-13]
MGGREFSIMRIDDGHSVSIDNPDSFINTVIPKTMAGHFLFDGEHAEVFLGEERLVALLQPDVALARGSACTSGIPEPSHVLRAMGLDANEAAEVVRLSTAPTTCKSEIAMALQCIAEAAGRMKVIA